MCLFGLFCFLCFFVLLSFLCLLFLQPLVWHCYDRGFVDSLTFAFMSFVYDHQTVCASGGP
ncbi:hypothetical protein P168DRAFT_289899 [Aspergillus campestris IBT 28561]|uniref:Uncharacterized protein n=1 Tax=Aspergillus campestris (strain IBT 28561) TaxID=1392248 RepID=A0A2I1D5C5_ASPC2|nr:uncharacterized protein P168DRAFT_289899 [Aspergillus campestris IBT 28561]PKY05076.1 hypothetical protein P168DRAFT_289899 [Aspergillus campestris IBT 28561]